MYQMAMATVPLSSLELGLPNSEDAVMHGPRSRRISLFVCGFALVLYAGPLLAQSPSRASSARDGQRDFDWEIGTWRTRLSRLLRPLTGSTEWVTYEGTTAVRKVWNGRANLVELEVDGSKGHIEALSLRPYDSDTRQWSLNFANSRIGTMAVPAVGAFTGGRGEFGNPDSLDGRPILVRFVIMPITQDSARFEQSFSGDGGKTWELNWVATDTRVSDSSRK
jgi:hypothetical protein